MEVTIKIVNHGVIVCASNKQGETEYVFKDVKGALKELEGIISVLKENEPKPTKSDLDEEEEEINRKDK